MVYEIILQLFLPIILFFGLVTSYEDVFKGKIRNSHIIASVVCSIALYLGMYIYGYINRSFMLDHVFWIKTIVNIMFTAALGFGLWHINFWSAGDAKLFMTYGFIIPLTAYNTKNSFLFEPAFILYNTFIPFFILSIIVTMRERIRTPGYGGFIEEFKLKKLMSKAAYTFTFVWFSGFILYILGIEKNIISVTVVSGISLVIFDFLLEQKILTSLKLKKIIKISLGTIIIALRIYFEHDTISTLNFWGEFFVYFVIISIINSYAKSQARVFFTRQVRIINLKQGMILGDKIIKKNGKYKIASNNDLVKGLESPFPNSLDDKAIKELTLLYKDNKLDFSYLNIHKTMPFAPLMFLGVILTIIAGGVFNSIII